MTPEEYAARCAIIAEHWPTGTHVREIVDLVNADGLEPRWSETVCRTRAAKMGLTRPERENVQPVTMVEWGPERIRAASNAFGRAYWEGITTLPGRPATTSIWGPTPPGPQNQSGPWIAKEVLIPDAAYIAAANPAAILTLLDRLDRQSALCAAMTRWLNADERRSQLPDGVLVLGSILMGAPGDVDITAGMIREAAR